MACEWSLIAGLIHDGDNMKFSLLIDVQRMLTTGFGLEETKALLHPSINHLFTLMLLERSRPLIEC